MNPLGYQAQFALSCMALFAAVAFIGWTMTQ